VISQGVAALEATGFTRRQLAGVLGENDRRLVA
jgi:hypothetical protein